MIEPRRRNYSLRDLWASWDAEKRAQDRLEPMIFFVIRPLSFPVTWVAFRAGLTANHVSALSLGVNLGGLGLMASGRPTAMVTGVALVLVALVLDCVDGTMARTTKRFTPMGEWLDALSAYLLYAGFHVCSGIGAWLSIVRGSPVVAWPADPAWGGALVALGAVAAAAMSIGVMMTAKFALVFQDVGRRRVVDRKGGGLYGVLFTIGRNLSFPSSLVLPITVLGMTARRLELVLAFYAVFNCTVLASLLGRCLTLARKASDSKSSGATSAR
jgi:phosphatidylglycerophosphate synthase